MMLLLVLTATPVDAASCSSKGACTLVFTAAPADAKVGSTITSVQFVPGAASVAVTIVYTDSGLPVTGFGGAITLALLQAPTNTATGILTGTVEVVPTDGVATFAGLKVDKHGDYKLKATSGTRVRSATSGTFSVWDNVDTCGNQPCPSNLNAPHETISIISTTTGGGILAASSGAENTANPCVLPPKLKKAQFGPNVTRIGGTISGTGTKTVTMTYDQEYVNSQPNNGASAYEVCYQTDVPFTDLTGATDVTTGLLPLCSAQDPVPPCILSKSKNSGNGTVTIILLLPAADPRMW